MGEGQGFTGKQELFIAWYVRLLNATEAAKRAGYSGDRASLGSIAAALLQNVAVKAEIDKRIKASIPSADEVLSRIGSTAMADVTPYLNEDHTLNVQELADAGLGHLVVGVKPGREGTEYTLANPQTSRKMLARYHKLLGADTQVDVNTTITASEDALAALTQQIAAASDAPTVEQDDTEDSTE